MNDFDFERWNRYYSKDLGLYPEDVASRMGMSLGEYERRRDQAVNSVNRYWDHMSDYDRYLDHKNSYNWWD